MEASVKMDVGYFRFKDDVKKTRELNAVAHSFNGLNLIFFGPDDINFEEKTVTGQYYTADGWETKTVPLPKIINNMRFKKSKGESHLYRFLDDNSFLLFHNFGSKEHVENLLRKNNMLQNLIIPSKVIESKKDILDLFKNNDKLLFKPINGMKGRGIFTIEDRKGRYFYEDQEKSYFLDDESYIKLYKKIKNKFIGQKYIKSITDKNLPFDIRVQYEKNGKGQWVRAQTYARVGLSNPLVSNVDKGGAVIRAKSFFKHNFGEHQAEELLKKLRVALKGFPSKFEKLYDFNISTIAVDLGLHEGEFYLFEVNSFPGGTFARGEIAMLRAQHARHLAKKISNKNVDSCHDLLKLNNS